MFYVGSSFIGRNSTFAVALIFGIVNSVTCPTEGSINIEGSSVSVECKGSVPHGLLTAVNANDGVTIKSTQATITGEYGIFSEEGPYHPEP